MSQSALVRSENENVVVARTLRELGDRLAEQKANTFRINAYYNAADTIEELEEKVAELIARKGRDGLTRLPGIGNGLAATIEEIVHTGRSSVLDRLNGTTEPDSLFQFVPGVGPVLAKAIYERLNVDSLEGLDLAAHDGRLETIPGIGKRRATAIRMALSSIRGRHTSQKTQHVAPPVSDLIAIDQEYRSKDAMGILHKITPLRLNPQRKNWLPVLHTQRGDRHYTALYSNTARAHNLGRTRDWVLVYYYDHEGGEGHATIVTEWRGPLRGHRVVRGRESECSDYYRSCPVLQ